jgi:hypothetical protein
VSPQEHISAERLAALAAGELPEADREAVLRHLEECAPCGDRLAAVLLLRRGRTSAPARGWIALAAAAALVLLAGAWVLLPPAPAERSAPAASTPQPLPPERQAVVDRFAGYARSDNIKPEIYDFVMRVLYPETTPVSPDQHQAQTREAIIDLRDGRYDEAVDQFAALYIEYPDFPSLAGWLGVSLYLEGETDPVVLGLLDRGRESGVTMLQELGLWYGAQYLLRTGEPEAAVGRLRELAQIRDHIGRLGKAQLEELPLEELGMSGDGGVPQT